jgi:hypothetical protein
MIMDGEKESVCRKLLELSEVTAHALSCGYNTGARNKMLSYLHYRETHRGSASRQLHAGYNAMSSHELPEGATLIHVEAL